MALARWGTLLVGLVWLANMASAVAAAQDVAPRRPTGFFDALLHPRTITSAAVDQPTSGTTAGMISATAGGPASNSAMQAVQRAREIGGQRGFAEAVGIGAAPDLLQDSKALKELLGSDPRWVWHVEQGKARTDPMLIPWVADKLMFDVREAEAKSLIAQGKLEEALQVYQKLLPSLTETTYQIQVRTNIIALQARIEELKKLPLRPTPTGSLPAQKIVEPVLPQGLADQTRAIIYDPNGGSFVSIGDQILKTGDEVQGFQGVKIKQIKYQSVVFSVTNEFMTKDYEVPVRGDALP